MSLTSLKFLFEQYLKLFDICWEKTIKKSSLLLIDAVAQRYSVKEMFFEISQNALENTCARVSFLIKMQASKHGNEIGLNLPIIF